MSRLAHEHLCECGCGQPTTIYRGKPRHFLSGHNPPSSTFVAAGRGQRRGRGTRIAWLRSAIAEPSDACIDWPWTSDDYGQLAHEGRKQEAHRFAWELACGDVPDDLEIHHTCENPRCVNPAHLAAVTRREHMTIDGRLDRWPLRGEKE